MVSPLKNTSYAVMTFAERLKPQALSAKPAQAGFVLLARAFTRLAGDDVPMTA